MSLIPYNQDHRGCGIYIFLFYQEFVLTRQDDHKSLFFSLSERFCLCSISFHFLIFFLSLLVIVFPNLLSIILISLILSLILLS